MGFFNQSLAQIRDLFASMTPAARITSALLLGVIVVSLGYLFQGYAGASEELLFNGEILQPRETIAVQAAIAKAGLKVLPPQAGRIVVPRGESTAYLAAIADAGALPQDFDKLLEESLDTGMFENGETKKARFKAARERQLSMVVSMMSGIDDAKVMYDIRDPVAFEKARATATVSVLPDIGSTLEPHQMKMIREAVAGAISGLDPSAVTILNLSTGSELAGNGVSAESFDDPYYPTRLAYEQSLKRNIENLLHFVQPAARVQVSAELDPMITSDIQSVKPDGEGTAISESKATQSTSNTQVEDRGQPGLTAQGPGRTPAEQAVAKNENTTESETIDTQNFIPHLQENRRELGLTPKQVRAAIAIPSDYLVRVWRERTPDAAPDAKPDVTMLDQIEEQTRTKIKAMVAQLFPKEIAANAQTNVEVTMFQSLTPAAIPEPSLASEGLLWASTNSGSLIMAGLAIVSLVMLRSMIKSIPAADSSLAFRTPMVIPETAVEEGGAKPSGRSDAPATPREGARRRLRLNKGPTLKDDLTELVKEDPDGAAAILRTWIGNAA
jgi:flagellar M-ring protein FliF